VLVGNNNNEARMNTFLQPGDTPKDFAAAQKLSNLLFTCQSRDVANLRVAQKVPTWRYLYSGDWPNLSAGPGTGAWHSAEIPIVFGTVENLSGLKNTKEENKVMSTMMHAWAEFARDPDNGLKKLGWPVWDQTSRFRPFYFIFFPLVDYRTLIAKYFRR
jgi:carboxylesterase type B